MKNKIYPFLLGLSCIVIVALVSFKNSEKATEKEQMIVVAELANGSYDLHTSTAGSHEVITIKETTKGRYQHKYSALLSKIEELEKQVWIISSSNIAFYVTEAAVYYSLEREKKQ